MMGTDLYTRCSVSSELWSRNQEKFGGQVLYALCLYIPMVLMLVAHPGGAQEKPGEGAPKLYRAFEKFPQHSEGHLYDNSNWSHDGTKIAVMVHDLEAENTSTIWVYHIATETFTQITHADTIGMMDAIPVWSPDDTQIAFASNRGGGLHIWVVDENGENLRKVTEDLELKNNGDVWTPRVDWTPDGESLVYADEVDDNWDIYQTNLTDGSVVRLTDDPAGDGSPRCSPDGKYISFKSERAGRWDLWLMDTASGEVEKFDMEISNMGWAYDWSPNSQWIVTDITPMGFGWRTRTAVVNMQTGEAFSVPAPSIEQQGYATWTPSWSSDGRSVLYSSQPLQTFDSSLKILDLQTEKITTLRDSLVQIGQLIWSPDNKQIAYFSIQSATEEGVDQDSLITLVNAQGEVNSTTSFSGKDPHWSPDGTQIAYVTTGRDGGALEFYDVKQDRITTVNTDHDGRNEAPRFSPDGELLAYVSSQGKDADLWVYDTVTKDHFQLTFSGGFKRWITWSPDGESTVFAHNPGGPGNFFDLWIVPALGGKNRRITVHERNDVRPLWREGVNGPIYYASQRQNNWELWKTDLEGNEEHVLRSSAITWPVLIQDSSNIYYMAGEGWWDTDLYLTNTDTDTEKQLTDGNVRDAKSSPDATKIAYSDYEDGVWDQGVLWIADVGDLFPLKPIP